MSIKAVIFDMDGVLIDSIKAWHKTFNDVLGLHGQEEVSFEKFTSEILGLPIEEDIRLFFPDLTVDELRRTYFDNFRNHVVAVEEFPDTHEVLSYLKGKGYKLAVATNTEKPITYETLRRLDLTKYFDVVCTRDDVENPKPHPEMLEKILRQLELTKEEVVFVGDTHQDREVAEAMGLRMIGFNYPLDESVNTLSELKEML